LLRHVEPEDLLKFGMIPEFIGRLPIVTALEELDETALVDILSQPKNALVKQYRKLFDLDGVSLKFTDGALKAVSVEAIRRKAGARGLRSILENAMLDVMYEIPSRKTVREVVISEEVILKKSEPVILYSGDEELEPKKESA
jgi:ATP-dependent Clp protease ATP-binding subunit ClpX